MRVAALILVTAACGYEPVLPPAEPDGQVVDSMPDTAPDAQSVFTPSPFADTYDAHNVLLDRCDHLMHIVGREPAEAGRYPVALFLVGTNADYDGAGITDHVLPLLASHGFVAASIEYENSTLFGAAQNCSLYADNASCMIRNADDYAAGRRSALARICGRPQADCSKGVVLLGHSQGGLTALQAFQFAPVTPPVGEPVPRLVAVAPMGVGPRGYLFGLPVIDLSGCATAGTIAVDPQALLVVNGEHDVHFNGADSDSAGGQDELQRLTGRTCAPGTYDCRGAQGDGWVMVEDGQVSTGHAGHGYMDAPEGAFSEPNWSAPDNLDPWSLEHAARWLRSRAEP